MLSQVYSRLGAGCVMATTAVSSVGEVVDVHSVNFFSLCDKKEEGKDGWTGRSGDWNGPKRVLRESKSCAVATTVV